MILNGLFLPYLLSMVVEGERGGFGWLKGYQEVRGEEERG